MKIIGLCGGSGSGKGTVAKFFANYGVASIDTDAVYHEITRENTPCVDELSARFGGEILLPGGGLNRKALGKIVFADESGAMLSELGEITHKHIRRKTEELIDYHRSRGALAVIIDAPLLFESRFSELCDVTVAVLAPISVRIDRIMARDGIARDMAEKRIAAQLSDERLAELSDYVIRNDLGLDALALSVDRVAKEILSL